MHALARSLFTVVYIRAMFGSATEQTMDVMTLFIVVICSHDGIAGGSTSAHGKTYSQTKEQNPKPAKPTLVACFQKHRKMKILEELSFISSLAKPEHPHCVYGLELIRRRCQRCDRPKYCNVLASIELKEYRIGRYTKAKSSKKVEKRAHLMFVLLCKLMTEVDETWPWPPRPSVKFKDDEEVRGSKPTSALLNTPWQRKLRPGVFFKMKSHYHYVTVFVRGPPTQLFPYAKAQPIAD